MPPELAMQWSAKQVCQWREAQIQKVSGVTGRMQNQQKFATHWTAPAEGNLKVNVDASVFKGRSSYSIGMVLRDHMGVFCRAKVKHQEGEVSVFEVETWGVLETIKWARKLCISKVEIESDSMLTVQAVKQGSPNYLEVGIMIQECRILLDDLPDFSISFVKKQANKVAHTLARVPCEANCFREFLSPPQIVLEKLMYDVSLI